MDFDAFKNLRANIYRVRHALLASPDRVHDAAAITDALAERLKEILSTDEFQVETDGRMISIKGVGSCAGYSYNTIPSLLWNLPDPPSTRLDLIFTSVAEGLQRLLTKAHQTPWPVRGAEPYVRVTADTIKVWWGGPDEVSSAVCLRAIDRLELGI